MRIETRSKTQRKRLMMALLPVLALASLALLSAEPRLGGRRNSSSQSQEFRLEGRPQADAAGAISVTVPVVALDVMVTDNEGNYLTGLKKENFRVTEDGLRQTITTFATTDAPITVVLLLEYSQLGGGTFLYNATSWAEVFLRQLQPEDWVTLSTFFHAPESGGGLHPSMGRRQSCSGLLGPTRVS